MDLKFANAKMGRFSLILNAVSNLRIESVPLVPLAPESAPAKMHLYAMNKSRLNAITSELGRYSFAPDAETNPQTKRSFSRNGRLIIDLNAVIEQRADSNILAPNAEMLRRNGYSHHAVTKL